MLEKLKMSHLQTPFTEGNGSRQSRAMSYQFSGKRSEFNSDGETSEVEVITKEVVLRRPLPTYPPKVRKAPPSRHQQGLARAPRPGGFRVRHGFQVRGVTF